MAQSKLVGILTTVFLVITAYFAQPKVTYGIECTSAMYSGSSFETSTRTFSPYDKIYVRVDCKKLKAGAYVMHMNWVHKRKGLVRSDSHGFKIDKEQDKRVFFWFKLSRRGPLKSAFTNQDFYEGHFGDWTVRGFLNDDLVSEVPFTITN